MNACCILQTVILVSCIQEAWNKGKFYFIQFLTCYLLVSPRRLVVSIVNGFWGIRGLWWKLTTGSWHCLLNFSLCLTLCGRLPGFVLFRDEFWSIKFIETRVSINKERGPKTNRIKKSKQDLETDVSCWTVYNSFN